MPRRTAPRIALLAAFSLFFPSLPSSLPAAAGPDDLGGWHRFIDEYSAHFQQEYGPDVKSRYQLHLRELAEMQGPDFGRCRPPVKAPRALTRWVDGIILEGRHLPRLLGRPLENLRVLVYGRDRWQSVPFQFDEVTAAGSKVLPEGPGNNASLGNGLLDEQDELVLMAHDVGHQVEESAWPAGAVSGHEVEALDPVTGQKGWFYVFAYEKEPPEKSPVWYRGAVIPVEPVTGYQSFSPYYLCHGKTIRYRGKDYNQIFYKGLYQSPLAGGTGTDYVDRMKWRLRIRFLFGSLKISFDEDSLTGEFFAWKSGPVRGTYRVWAMANLPLGLKSPRIVADVIQIGENIISTTTSLRVPFNPGYVITDMSTRIGTDLNRRAEGMKFYNSNNLQGALIDGKPDPTEKGLSRERDEWRLICGPHAALMNRSYWCPRFLKQARSVEVYLVDDLAVGDPPEFSKGQIGAVFSEATVGNLKAGEYAIGIEWYFLNDFPCAQGPDLETIHQFLRYQDAPLLLGVAGTAVPNKSVPALGTPWQ